jgi:uncharacterized membrane protein YfcA
MPLPADFYFFAIPAVILVGLSKGGFAGSMGMLGVPIMALSLSPVQAAAIMLPILVVMDMVGLWAYRGKADWTILRIMIPAACLGIGLGWLMADLLSAELIRLAVGLTALAFVFDYVLGKLKKNGSGQEQPKKGSISAIFWGAVSGLTSFIAHVGGPPYQIHTLSLRLDKITFVATSVYFFTIVNAIKLVPYFALGQFSTQNLQTSLTLLPLAPIATLAGIWLVRHISQTYFYRLAYVAMFVIALKLIWDSVSAWL